MLDHSGTQDSKDELCQRHPETTIQIGKSAAVQHSAIPLYEPGQNSVLDGLPVGNAEKEPGTGAMLLEDLIIDWRSQGRGWARQSDSQLGGAASPGHWPGRGLDTGPPASGRSVLPRACGLRKQHLALCGCLGQGAEAATSSGRTMAHPSRCDVARCQGQAQREGPPEDIRGPQAPIPN